MGDHYIEVSLHLYIHVRVAVCTFTPSQDTNVLGFKGPRKMTVIIPALSNEKERVAVKPKKVSRMLSEWSKPTPDSCDPSMYIHVYCLSPMHFALFSSPHIL